MDKSYQVLLNLILGWIGIPLYLWTKKRRELVKGSTVFMFGNFKIEKYGIKTQEEFTEHLLNAENPITESRTYFKSFFFPVCFLTIR